jgi:hypothetical protein
MVLGFAFGLPHLLIRINEARVAKKEFGVWILGFGLSEQIVHSPKS